MQKQLIFISLAVVELIAIWMFIGNDEQTENVNIQPVQAA